MTLPVIIAIVSTLFFGVLAILYSLKEEKVKKLLEERNKQHNLHAYELSVHKQLQQQINVPLDADKILDIISNNLNDYLHYSTVSVFVVKQNKMIFKMLLKESISTTYINSIKENMKQSLGALMGNRMPTRIIDYIYGAKRNNVNHMLPKSYFHIPLVVKDTVQGLVTISAGTPNAFTDEQMSSIYQLVDSAAHTLERIEELTEIEKYKLMATVGSLPDGFFMVDINKQLYAINNAAKDYLNIQKQKPNLTDILSSLPNTYDFNSRIIDAMSLNKTLVESNVLIEKRLFKITITPIHQIEQSKEQNIIGASVMLHDMTTEKSASQMKEDFTNIIVHELRSPLTSIKASTELLNSSTPLTDEERNRLIFLISEQSKKLLDEVSVILDAAKIEAGLFTVHKIPGDIKKLVHDTASTFFPQAQEKTITLTVNIDDTIPKNVLYDPHHLGRVVTNLLSNSFKFTGSEGKIAVNAKLESNNVVISVTDTGVGIAKEKQHLLFSKFSQVSTPNAHVGTGLGLYITKGIIEAHGGTISIDSELGKGTTFTFTLPVIQQVVESSMESPTTAAAIKPNIVN